MPRLTFDNYYLRYRLLHETWKRYPEVFALLLPNEQWALFDYFEFHVQRNEEQLKDHFNEMGKQAGSLPQRARRAYKRFEPTLADALKRAHATPTPQPRGKREYDMKVYGQVQPEVNVGALMAVVRMIMQDKL